MENTNFRFFGNKKIVANLPEFLKSLQQNGMFQFTIGTDSIQSRGKTLFYTVLAYRIPTGGANSIYIKNVTPRIANVTARMMAETGYSVQVAMQIAESKENNIVISSIELDINADRQWKSNDALDASIGWVKGIGFKVNYKNKDSKTSLEESPTFTSGSLMSTAFADKLCKKYAR